MGLTCSDIISGLRANSASQEKAPFLDSTTACVVVWLSGSTVDHDSTYKSQVPVAKCLLLLLLTQQLFVSLDEYV